jgi:betaine-aldehyde dehydrogenase
MTIQAQVAEFPMFVDGRPREASSGGWLEVRSPATGELVGRVPAGTVDDVDAAVVAARRAFEAGVWSRTPPAERAAVLWRLADRIEAEADELARLETLQTGTAYKLRRDSDLPFAVDNLRFFAGAARILEGKGATEYTGSHTSFVRREPIGVVGQVAPWNYPLWMAVWKIGPALAAGNSVVLKPASATPLTTLRLAALARDAGLPDGVLNVVTGRGDPVGTAIARHPDVDMVSLTGDTETGKAVMAAAAANLKRVHLELGGKAPLLVFADADLEAAARGATAGALINGGQDCTAATRCYVERPLLRPFVDRLRQLFEAVRIGDPFAPTTDLGTLISRSHVERVHGFVERARAAGATIVTGGEPVSLPGFLPNAFYRPTVVTDVDPAAEIVCREVFGPVLVVLPFDTADEAIRLANATRYGLAASVWTTNVFTAFNVARALNFGHVLVNDHLMIASEMPHGGFRESGFGKDMSLYALEEYTQIKHVMVELTGAAEKGWHYTIFGEKPAGG